MKIIEKSYGIIVVFKREQNEFLLLKQGPVDGNDSI
jgi:hypothetical protein